MTFDIVTSKTQQEVSVDSARYTTPIVFLEEESWSFGAWIAENPNQVPHRDKQGASMQTRRLYTSQNTGRRKSEGISDTITVRIKG